MTYLETFSCIDGVCSDEESVFKLESDCIGSKPRRENVSMRLPRLDVVEASLTNATFRILVFEPW